MAAPGPELALPAAPALAVTVSGSGQRLLLKRKKVLSAEEAELFELAQAAGIGLDPELFRILLDLLKMNVAPLAVFQMLKSMCAGHRISDTSSAESHSAAVPPNLPETRELSFGSAENSKIPAPLSFSSSGLRSPRRPASKLMVYSPAEAGSPLSQGRNKPNPSASGTQAPAERGHREGSGQRGPRQPSSSRLQKSGSSGKSTGSSGS